MNKDRYPTVVIEGDGIESMERLAYLALYTDSVEAARRFFHAPDALVRLDGWGEHGSLYLIWAAPFPPPDLELWSQPDE